MNKLKNKIKKQEAIIADILSIIAACTSTIEGCNNQGEYDLAMKDLAIASKEKERQTMQLHNLIRESVLANLDP